METAYTEEETKAAELREKLSDMEVAYQVCMCVLYIGSAEYQIQVCVQRLCIV